MTSPDGSDEYSPKQFICDLKTKSFYQKLSKSSSATFRLASLSLSLFLSNFFSFLGTRPTMIIANKYRNFMHNFQKTNCYLGLISSHGPIGSIKPTEMHTTSARSMWSALSFFIASYTNTQQFHCILLVSTFVT